MVLVVAVLALAAPYGWAGFQGSKHDFGGCGSCHVPHGSNSEVGFLWNLALADRATFQVRTDATLDDGSLLCMSCHDGQTAAGATPGGDAVLGKNLRDDHPVGVTYRKADNGFNTTPSLPLFGDNDDQVSCGTCHDVHGTADFGDLLRIQNTGSSLCLECHIK